MLLFFYGVLLDSVAEGSVRSLLRGLGPGHPATIKGRLYAVAHGDRFYPALLPGERTVHGMAHEAGTANLSALDRFEDVRPDGTGEYRRVPVEIVLGGVTEMAAAYLYNRSLSVDLVPIQHGDFCRWLRETGARPFA